MGWKYQIKLASIGAFVKDFKLSENGDISLEISEESIAVFPEKSKPEMISRLLFEKAGLKSFVKRVPGRFC